MKKHHRQRDAQKDNQTSNSLVNRQETCFLISCKNSVKP